MQNKYFGVFVVLFVICIYAGLVARDISRHRAKQADQPGHSQSIILTPTKSDIPPLPSSPQPQRQRWVAIANEDPTRRGEVLAGLISESGAITSLTVLVPVNGSDVKNISPGYDPNMFWVTSTVINQSIRIHHTRLSSVASSYVESLSIQAPDGGSLAVSSADSCADGRQLLLIWQQTRMVDELLVNEANASVFDLNAHGSVRELWRIPVMRSSRFEDTFLTKVKIIRSWAFVAQLTAPYELILIPLEGLNPVCVRYNLRMSPQLIVSVDGDTSVAVIGAEEQGTGVQLVHFTGTRPTRVTDPVFVTHFFGQVLQADMRREQGKLTLRLVRRGSSAYERYELPL